MSEFIKKAVIKGLIDEPLTSMQFRSRSSVAIRRNS